VYFGFCAPSRSGIASVSARCPRWGNYRSTTLTSLATRRYAETLSPRSRFVDRLGAARTVPCAFADGPFQHQARRRRVFSHSEGRRVHEPTLTYVTLCRHASFSNLSTTRCDRSTPPPGCTTPTEIAPRSGATSRRSSHVQLPPASIQVQRGQSDIEACLVHFLGPGAGAEALCSRTDPPRSHRRRRRFRRSRHSPPAGEKVYGLEERSCCRARRPWQAARSLHRKGSETCRVNWR